MLARRRPAPVAFRGDDNPKESLPGTPTTTRARVTGRALARAASAARPRRLVRRARCAHICSGRGGVRGRVSRRAPCERASPSAARDPSNRSARSRGARGRRCARLRPLAPPLPRGSVGPYPFFSLPPQPEKERKATMTAFPSPTLQARAARWRTRKRRRKQAKGSLHALGGAADQLSLARHSQRPLVCARSGRWRTAAARCKHRVSDKGRDDVLRAEISPSGVTPLTCLGSAGTMSTPLHEERVRRYGVRIYAALRSATHGTGGSVAADERREWPPPPAPPVDAPLERELDTLFSRESGPPAPEGEGRRMRRKKQRSNAAAICSMSSEPSSNVSPSVAGGGPW